MLGWKKHKLELSLPGEISITSDMQMTPPLWQKVNRNYDTIAVVNYNGITFTISSRLKQQN